MARKVSLEVKQRRYGYVFTLPFIIGGIIFLLFPLVLSVVMSFAEVTNGDQFLGFDYKFFGFGSDYLGFDNYYEILFSGTEFRDAILSALSEMIYYVPVVVIFAFFIASVLNEKFRGRGFARSIMFMPLIISSGLVVSLSSDSLASSIISSGDRFNEAVGSGGAIQVTEVFETMLEDMDLSDWMIDLIINSVSGISTIVSMAAVSIVIFIAGLQSISPSIYEASYIEGATKWEVFWKISLPMVSPLILLSVIYTIVDSFSNNSVVTMLHNKVVATTFDIASAMAVVYSLIILLILVVVFAILNKVVFYQD